MQLAAGKRPANLAWGAQLRPQRVKSVATILMAVLALALAGLSFAAWRQCGELKEELGRAQDQSRSLQDELVALRSRGGGNDNANGRAGSGGGAQAVLPATNTLEYQKLAGIDAKARLDIQYAALFRNLARDFSLTAEKIDQFKDLLVKRQQMLTDAMQAAGGPGAYPAAAGQAVGNARAIVDEQIRSQLGNAAFSRYRQYEQTLPERSVISELGLSLSYTQDPLTDDQTDQLIPILASTQPDGPDNAGAGPAAGGSAVAVISDAAVLQAKGVLSQAQFKALQRLQIAQQARQKMDRIRRRP